MNWLLLQYQLFFTALNWQWLAGQAERLREGWR